MPNCQTGLITRTLGLDVGIASVGWGIVDTWDGGGEVVASGVWRFSPPESNTSKGVVSKSAERRLLRGTRRTRRHKRQRMRDVREVLHDAGLLPDASDAALRIPAVDPWSARVEGLDRRLSSDEFAAALGHVAAHRGFRSSATGANEEPEDGVILKAAAAVGKVAASWRTVAEAVVRAPEFGEVGQARRYRNRTGNYTRTILRHENEREVRLLFTAQRRFGNLHAHADVEAAYVEAAFFQRPAGDADHMVGPCPFEPGLRRASLLSPTFERFRLLSSLLNARIVHGHSERALEPMEVRAALDASEGEVGVTFAQVRSLLGLASGETFKGIPPKEEAKRDLTSRTGNALEGTSTLRSVISNVLGEPRWSAVLGHAGVVDAIADAVTFIRDPKRLERELRDRDVPQDVAGAVLDGAASGAFDGWKGAANLSAVAMAALSPHMAAGMPYRDACLAAGYDPAASAERRAFSKPGKSPIEAITAILSGQDIDANLVGSPTARKALIETLKQVRALFVEYGIPDRIHVETARDLGKSIEERAKIDAGILKRTRFRLSLKAELAELWGFEPTQASPSHSEVERFEMWKEQLGRCAYTDAPVDPRQLADGDGSVDVDHILPVSRTADNSRHNKCLALVAANREKGNRSPHEWFGHDESRWAEFVARVEGSRAMRGLKKRNFLLKDLVVKEVSFVSRNLTDTRYATKLIATALAEVTVPIEGQPKVGRTVFTRSGAVTDLLRRCWGLQWTKKDDDGNRIADHRHHAVDALVVAACSEGTLQGLTRKMQGYSGVARKAMSSAARAVLPWESFREEVVASVEGIVPGMAVRRRGRGSAHLDTVLSVSVRDGEEVLYKRLSLDQFKEKHLPLVKDPERNAAVIEALRAWLGAGSPKDAPPRSPKGDPIRAVRVRVNDRMGVKLRRGGPDARPGSAGRETMVRVDVFSKTDAKGKRKHFAVPVYVDDLTRREPPMVAPGQGDPKSWPVMDGTHEFLFSLNRWDMVRYRAKPDAVEVVGIFTSLDRSDGRFLINCPLGTEWKERLAVRMAPSIGKVVVDRLGRVHEVRGEKRTWRGEACTLQRAVT